MNPSTGLRRVPWWNLMAMTALTGLLLAAVSLSADATTGADPAPTDVTVSWADTAHTVVRVTWQETGSQPNVIASGSIQGPARYTSAADANQIDIPAYQLIAGRSDHFAVSVGTEAAGPTSPAGLSAVFDTLAGPQALIDSIVAAGSTKLTVRWHPATVTDPNPGDPLDLPPADPQYAIESNYDNVNDFHLITPKSTATMVTFTQPSRPPYKFFVLTYNEWGTQYSATQYVDYEKWVRALIPAAADYGRTAPITGTIERWMQGCDLGPCWAQAGPENPRLIVLQARDTATSAWYTVGSTKTDATGNFKISPTTLGTRQYRVVVPDIFNRFPVPDFLNHDGFGYGLISNAVTTAARPRATGKFLDASVKYGTKVTAHVAIAPPANTASTLQRWDGIAWRSLKSVPITKGAGDYTFTATQRGRVAYRFLVPAFSYAGRPLTWQVSNSFVLTTS